MRRNLIADASSDTGGEVSDVTALRIIHSLRNPIQKGIDNIDAGQTSAVYAAPGPPPGRMHIYGEIQLYLSRRVAELRTVREVVGARATDRSSGYTGFGGGRNHRAPTAVQPNQLLG